MFGAWNFCPSEFTVHLLSRRWAQHQRGCRQDSELPRPFLWSWLRSHFESSSDSPSPAPSPSPCSNPGPSEPDGWCVAAERMKKHLNPTHNETNVTLFWNLITSKQGKRLASSMKRGRRTNRMNPVWDEGLVTLSLSMNGVTGRPSSFSTSLWRCEGETDEVSCSFT